MSNSTLPILPFERWHSIDQAAWIKAHRDGGYFEETGLASGWSPETRRFCRKGYGRWQGFLGQNALLGSVARVSSRVQNREVLRIFIDELRAVLAPQTVVATLGAISQTVRAMDPDGDRTLLLRARSVLKRQANPLPRRHENLLRPPELWQLGTELCDEAESGQLSRQKSALLYRNGLIIACLSLCPIRSKNLVSLRVGQHVVCHPDDRGLHIPAEELKTKNRDYNVELPLALSERLSRYHDYHRSFISNHARADPTALWLTTRGTRMTRSTLYGLIRKILKERRGVHFTPHMFRHSVATFICEVAPEKARLAIGTLGHSQWRSTHQYYVRGQQLKTVRMYQSSLTDIISHRSQNRIKNPEEE